MTDIVPSRNIIQVEETKYKASVSEATMQRIGASINFIINKIYDRLYFEWGQVPRVTTYSEGLQGIRYIYETVEISRYILSTFTAGTSGTNAVNFSVYNEFNTLLGDLFSTPPSIGSGAGNRAIVGKDVENSQDILAGASKVVGILNYTQLNSGWYIIPKITSAQVDSRHMFFELVVKGV